MRLDPAARHEVWRVVRNETLSPASAGIDVVHAMQLMYAAWSRPACKAGAPGRVRFSR